MRWCLSGTPQLPHMRITPQWTPPYKIWAIIHSMGPIFLLLDPTLRMSNYFTQVDPTYVGPLHVVTNKPTDQTTPTKRIQFATPLGPRLVSPNISPIQSLLCYTKTWKHTNTLARYFAILTNDPWKKIHKLINHHQKNQDQQLIGENTYIWTVKHGQTYTSLLGFGFCCWVKLLLWSKCC